MTIHAPFTPEQVRRLNEYQHAGQFHPYTCGNCRDNLGTENGMNDRLLVATEQGWECPTCDYTQNWAL